LGLLNALFLWLTLRVVCQWMMMCDFMIGNRVTFGAYASGLALKISTNSLGLNANCCAKNDLEVIGV